MTSTILGLTPRWQRSFDWRMLGSLARSLAPRRLGELVIARAGIFVVGVDATTGALAWKQQVGAAATLDGFVLERCGDLVVTDWRDDETRHGHLQAVDATGTRRWDIELASVTSAGVVALDARTVATTTLATTWELATIDASGAAVRRPLPHPSSALARLDAGRWLFGNSGMARNHPSLYVVHDDSATPVAAAKQVFHILTSDAGPLTVERESDHQELVARGHDLAPRWRTSVGCDLVAAHGALVVAFTGDNAHPIPTAFDLTTGEIRWRAAPLPYPASGLAAVGDHVLAVHEEGAVLLSAAGARLGEHEGSVGRPDISDGTVCLYVDKALVCLAGG